jgi:hypothetical protein
MADAPSSPPSDIQSRRCSRVPFYVLAAVLALLVVSTYLDFTEDIESFIKQTGGELCWAYSSIEVHRALILIEDAIVAIVTCAVWVMIRAGYCRSSLVTFGLFLAVVAARGILFPNDCSP